MKAAIKQVVEGNNLSIEEAKRVMNLLLSGEATQAQIGAFLTALRMKGETLDEIVGCASVLKDKAEHISPKLDSYVDLVGTGGDCTYSFNVSTTASFVVAGAGLAVAKHGNRSISSKSGAADVLEALGVNIMTSPELVEKAVEEVGIGFMFAQTFNKSMRFVGQARSEMGVRSIFNILGPLANPSGAKYQVIGVFSRELTEVFAKAMKMLGVERAMVVNAGDGMDEISVAADTYVSEIKDGEIINYVLTPEQFGFQRADLEALRGGDAKENAVIAEEILSGAKGPKRDIILLNAGATLYVGNKAGSIEEGIELAEKSIDSGEAFRRLKALVAFSNKQQ
ncbi:anthranilate phosphoribosyltransferase [Anaeromicropila populeti]|uniref:Anthranilate phosphoribosyltransferase n=1 Tax=Anaeromicropila populeti TaxID=37658 RepID=A0A1I6KX70_9FIRM|nr:anthranilate phosphoribosyltransferase [Anaeromicropila populeti]SFR95550.1 anthranilate phosphoribosyltransferase [Anaeromicropila populeti]